MNIAFLIPYPEDSAPSQRFRFEQYLHMLEGKNISYKLFSFYTESAYKTIYLPGSNLRKAFLLSLLFLRRFFHLFQIIPYTWVFIHREASPLGTPLLEWILAKIFRKKIIFDFDDAIWMDSSRDVNHWASPLRSPLKTKKIIQWSTRISVGNRYLMDYAQQFHHDVIINPTTIDTENLHSPHLFTHGDNELFTIGWTGTHSTMPYIEQLLPVLNGLSFPFQFILISNRPPLQSYPWLKFVNWNKATEIQDLIQLDIGLMPLENEEWANGKCGFKILQYMALEIPALASPVGVNQYMVHPGINGYLCDGEEDWLKYLEILYLDPSLRKELGLRGREYVEQNYSVKSNYRNFLRLFE